MLSFIKQLIFGDPNTQKVKKLKKVLAKINKVNEIYSTLSDKDLLKEHTNNKSRQNQDLVIHGFALIREITKRTIGLYQYDEQILGSLVLNEGNIAEMKTGEGKTLISPLAAYIAHIKGFQVHIISANEYLSERDCKWLKSIYNFLGISSGYVLSNMNFLDKITNYKKDIVYLTATTLGHDYLKDNLRGMKQPKLIQKLDFAIIDEIDYILIDEARTPLVISGPKSTNMDNYKIIHDFVKNLKEDDYAIDLKSNTINLTEQGIANAEKQLSQYIKNDFYDVENLHILNGIEQSLRANYMIFKDKDYIVKDNSIMLIDQMSGRILAGRSLSDGLQQFIQIKENLQVESESQTLASITFTNLFRSYNKLAGMSGTALNDSEEFNTLFNLNVVAIPTHKPLIRKDLNDRVFGTKKEKYNALIQDIITIHKTEQPILIGTISVEQSEYVSSELTKNKIPHNVLNAKNPYKESEIIADAGKLKAITISTNMAGRGTDILLGGHDGKNTQEVKNLGGLMVIGVERNIGRRNDDQLIGRSGRQGDPGTSVFYVSCEDDLMKRFQNLTSLISGEKIEFGFITSKILSTQKEYEKMNYQTRKYLVEFDDIINEQRKIIYEQRDQIFNIKSFKNTFISFVTNWLNNMQQKFEEDRVKVPYIKIKLENLLNLSIDKITSFDELRKDVVAKKIAYMEQLEEKSGDIICDYIKQFIIQQIDILWIEHINNLEYLKKGIMLRSYAQKDPMIEYKKESFHMFDKLLDTLQENTMKYISKLDPEYHNKN